ncbi:bacteriophage abortive infection AbiH family protein [Flavobacterium sp. K77]|uniref:AbiH family protein n=1 Tax=Flavobacterium sp. K77 TaxID=2910676 RepID=UPI001F4376D2|nr:AbiH family protein [Flavobacterium sp. K77]MCF6139962.1 bacteriophage abortive infection AbiH family protein [Flavobacterium sp. K77]
MNRLIILGNGFDLAHGLPTSYKDFINNFWKNFKDKYKSEDYQGLICTNDSYNGYFLDYGPIESLKDFIVKIKAYCADYQYVFDESNLSCFSSKKNDRVKIFSFKNYFFKLINEKKNIENWVDIENEYYILLKRCLNQDLNLSIHDLNNEFEIVKRLFEKYLIENIEKSFSFSVNVVGEIGDIFKVTTYKNEELNKFFGEISKATESFLIKKHQDILDKNRPTYGYLFSDDIIPVIEIENYFLSFNYTSIANNYIDLLEMDLSNLIEIHGRLEDHKNQINFGFGDEMDKYYQEIEEKDDNEYLKNIKSFQYLLTSNYKRLLDLIDSDKFQVYIMGHSCGLSDRTLLNTIFEHENCCSIKVFYHEIKDENGNVIKDNYTEIIQNISRHFNKKKLMREKIVNKTLCQPLPQVKLPLK